MNMKLLPADVLVIVAAIAAAGPARAVECHGVVIRLGWNADTVEKNAARLLAQRLNEQEAQQVQVVAEDDGTPRDPGSLLILLGIPSHHGDISDVFARQHIPPLTPLAPGPEGFLLWSLPKGNGMDVLAAAAASATAANPTG